MEGTQKRSARTATPLAPEAAQRRPAPTPASKPAKDFEPARNFKPADTKPGPVGVAGTPEPAAMPATPPLVAPLIIPDIGRLPESAISAPHSPLPDAPEPVPAAHPVEAATPGLARPAPDAWAAFAESQAALARGLEAFSIEMTGFARSGFSVAAETATAMLRVRTFGDAMALNAGFARQSFDALIGSSAKLSEIGVKLATDASRPLLSRFGESWKSGSIGV